MDALCDVCWCMWSLCGVLWRLQMNVWMFVLWSVYNPRTLMGNKVVQQSEVKQ